MDRDFPRSRAILISNAVFSDEGIPDLPGAAGCAPAMEALLTSDLCGWPAGQVEILQDVAAPPDLARKLVDLTEGVQDVLLLYYAGHGMRMPNGQLALALRETSSNRALLRHTAMVYKDIADILRGCPAATKLVILDCCHAELGNRASDQFQSTDIDAEPVDGLYCIWASKEWEKAKSPLSGGLTYFTDAFVRVVQAGIPGKPSQLTIDQIFTELRARMLRANLPEPAQSGIRDAHHWPFARNAAPPETHRDPDQEIASLTRRLADLTRRLAEFEGMKSATDAEALALQAEVERSKAQASHPGTAPGRRELQSAIDAAEHLLVDMVDIAATHPKPSDTLSGGSHRPVRRPANHESMPTAAAPQPPESGYRVLRLDGKYDALAMGNECVWVGNWERIEVWDFNEKTLIGASRAAADMLFAMPSADSCICCGTKGGYHSPDTVCVDGWKFVHSVDSARAEIRKAQNYKPSVSGDCTQKEYIDSVCRRAIDSERIFHTFSWILGPVALSEDGNQMAVVVDDPQKQIQVWNTPSGRQFREALPLETSLDELLFLREGTALVAVERPRAEGPSRISIWNVVSGRRTAEYELKGLTVNSVSRAHRDDQIVLGLDQGVAFLNVGDGNIEARLEIKSGPVRNCSFDPRSGRIGVLTDKEIIVIDSINIVQQERFSHGYAKGLRCDIRGGRMAALVADKKDGVALILWSVAS